jgi:hypothetical protein
MIPEFPEPQICTPAMYKALLSEKARQQAQLEEALYINGLRDETIALLEEKIRKLGESNSLMAGDAYVMDQLREKLDLEQGKSSRSLRRETELLETLSAATKMEQEYGRLLQKCTHLEKELAIMTKDADEMARENQELLQAFKTTMTLQSQLEQEKAINETLRQKISQLELKMQSLSLTVEG